MIEPEENFSKLVRKDIADFQVLFTNACQIIPMPEDLPGIFQIARQFNSIFPIIERIDAETARKIKPLAKFMEKIKHLDRDHIARKIPVFGLGDEKKYDKNGFNGPLHSFVGNFPLYCLLWHTYRTKESGDDQPYNHLQAHLLASWVEYPGEKKLSRFQSACRLVRRISFKEYTAIFEEIKDYAKDAHILFERILEILAYEEKIFQRMLPKDKKNNQILTTANLESLLKSLAEILTQKWELYPDKVIKNPNLTTSQQYQHSRRKSRSVYTLLIGPGHQMWDLAINQEKEFPLEALTLKKRPKQTGPDEPPAEDDIEYGIEMPVKDIINVKSMEFLPPLSTLWLASRTMANAIAMKNCRLVTDRDYPRDYELREIFIHLEGYLGRTPVSKNTDIELKDRETAVVIIFMIYFGLKLEDIKLIKTIDNESDFELNETQLAWDSNHQVWIRYIAPIKRNKTSGNPKHINQITISDKLHLSPLINLIPKISDDEVKWRNRINKFLSILTNSQVRPKWTKARNLPTLLWKWGVFSLNHETDYLGSSIMFQQEDGAIESQKYYTRIELTKIFEITEEFYSSWQTRMVESGYTPPLPPLSVAKSITQRDNFIVDDVCPDIDSVSKLNQFLIAQCSNKHKNLSKWEKARKLHNWKTVYLAVNLLICSGMRAIRTPIVDLTAISKDGWISIQDKDTYNENKVRITWLTEAIRKQISTYLNHLKLLLYGGPVNKSLYLDINSNKRRDLGIDRIPLRNTLFLLDEDVNSWQPREISGTEIMNFLNHDGWPTENAGRHILRSYLFNKDVNSLAINTLFGHWNYGTSSWGPWSGIDSRKLLEHVKPPILNLFEDINFKYVPFHD